jgi:hypothetical protein
VVRFLLAGSRIHILAEEIRESDGLLKPRTQHCGSGSFNDEGQIRATGLNGGTLIQFNTSGNTVADFEIFLETPVTRSRSSRPS